MLILRIITAAIGLPLLVAILWQGSGETVLWFFGLCSAIAVHEAALMVLPEFDSLFALHPATQPGVQSSERALREVARAPAQEFAKSSYRRAAILCASGMLILYFAVAGAHPGGGIGLVISALVLAILSSIFLTRGIDSEVSRMSGVLVTLVYAGLPWLLIWNLYESAPRAALVFMLLAIVWGGDTGAYFGGRFFGRHKLSPHKSPKKTWEGAIAGMIVSVGASIAVESFLGPVMGGVLPAAAAGVLCGSLGQLGDLVESVIKRFARVKDSGVMFPGHGGFLDRVDGLLVAAPGLWLLFALLRNVQLIVGTR